MDNIEQYSSSGVVKFPNSESDYEPLVPEGEYRLKLIKHETVRQFSGDRLVMTFSIIDCGESHGVLLNRYYCVEKLLGKPGKGGRCRHKRRGDFMVEYYRMFPDDIRSRLDRVPMEQIYNSVVIGRVRTVKSNCLQKTIEKPLWYSVVGELLGVEQ